MRTLHSSFDELSFPFGDLRGEVADILYFSSFRNKDLH